MSIASRLSLGMSDTDKEWIENILSINTNLQPKSPEFDSGVSLDSDMPAKERLDVDMDFLKSPLSVESDKLNGTEKSDVNIVDDDNTFYSDFVVSTSGPYSDLSPTNFFDTDVSSDAFTSQSQQPISTAASIPYNFELGKFSCNDNYNNNNNNNNNRHFSTTTSTATNKQFFNASTPATKSHFEFSGDNSDHHENLNTTSALSEEETNIKKEGMDDMKQKSRLLRNKKNAEMARVSRQKKKDHLHNLENEVKRLTEDNSKLKKENKSYLSIVKHKDREINYLKNILANHSALSQMIDYLKLKEKIHLSAEFSSNNHRPQISTPNCDQTSYDDEYYTTNNNHPHVAGICLHFKPDNHVSLEFCVKCSQSSQMIINHNQGQYCLDEENSNS